MRERYNVYGMTCSACARSVTKALDKIDGISDVRVDVIKNTVSFNNDKNVSKTDIFKNITEAGYKPDEYKEVETNNKKLKVVITNIILILILMYVSMGPMINIFPSFDMKYYMYYILLELVLVIPIMILNREYFINGFKHLIKKSPNMDTLVAIGASASFIYGIYIFIRVMIYTITKDYTSIHRFHDSLYLESVGMILTFVSIGKYIEGRSKKASGRAIDELMDMEPKNVLTIKDGKEEYVNINDVKPQDILIGKVGDVIGVDGVIIEGEAYIDEASLTGESDFREKSIDDKVFSGTAIKNGYIKYEALKDSDNSTLKQIINIMNDGLGSKAPISRLADKISGIFVPIVIVISIITFISWMIATKNVDTSLLFAISVLVISCPCALGLATPVAITVASAVGARNHTLFKNALTIEKLSHIDTIIFDKTGTITKGVPHVKSKVIYNDYCESIAYALESQSSHPLAHAICSDYVGEKLIIDRINTDYGNGINGYINNELYYAGSYKYLKSLNLDCEEKQANIYIFNSKEVLGYYIIEDELRETSKMAIKGLKSLGIETIMASGDNEAKASKIALEIGIDKVYSEVFPSDKLDIVNKYQNMGKRVLMVGDGINDTLALKDADIGCAIKSGSDVAQLEADMILMSSDLMDVYNALLLGRKTIRNIRLSLFWAFIYNVVFIPVASGMFYNVAGLKLNPMIASLLMSISSVCVCLNALSLFRFKRQEYKGDKNMETIINVKGMMCEHCVAHVKKACESVVGLGNANVDLKKKRVTVTYDGDISEVVKAIIEAGYEASL